jgi:outer membrane protein OmpA-like peptidoglycan-associated protein
MNAKLRRALACATLPAALAAVWIWLPGASAEQYGREGGAGQRQFVSDVFGGATRTIVTGQCIRTTMPDAGSAPAGCVEAPAETAQAAPAAAPPPAAAEPPAAPVARAEPPAQAEPPSQAEPPGAQAEPAAQEPVSEPVAEAVAEEQASTDSTYTEDVADTQAAIAPEPEVAPEPSPAEEIAETEAAMEPQSDAAADTAPAPEPPAEVVEAPAPAAPEPPAQEALPAPTPPAQPEPRKLRLAADTRFHFDRAELTPAGTADLDTLVGELAGMEVVAVTIVGYTDRIGPDDYNRKLSQRRADTVKAYLESHRLDAQRVEAVGRGKSDPVTTMEACKGLRGQRLIKCLAPDRRVEIEVVGLSTPAQ